MAGNGRRCRSRRDYAADVARTVKAGALSPRHLMSRPASGWLTALLKRDVEQLKEAVAALPTVECGSVTDGLHTEAWPPNAPQTASESRWRVAARVGPPPQPQVCRANPEPVFGPRGRLRGSDITSIEFSGESRGRSWASGGIRRAKGHSAISPARMTPRTCLPERWLTAPAKPAVLAARAPVGHPL
jgi:hypothetical protein